MYQINRSALVEHSAEQMFDLVNDVQSYKDFLPWCGDSVILEETNHGMVASVTIFYKGIDKTFITENRFVGKEKILLKRLDGPFSELHGVWQFNALNADCSRISLDLNFAFSNRFLEKLIAPIFKSIADSMIDSFVVRAEQIYAN